MDTRIAIPLVAGLLLAPGVVMAQQGQRNLQVYQMGKDIARLEEEMKEMRRLLRQLLELDRRRVELLSRALNGRSVSSEPARRSPRAGGGRSSSVGSSRAIKPPVRVTRGTVGGRVDLPSGLSSAYVYVENVRGRAVRNRTIEIAQKNRQFSPRYAVIQRGTRVRFPNLDSIYHNVFSRGDTATFDLGIYRSGDDAKSYVFTKPGIAGIYCNMHSKMTAEILVVPNHLYTRVGDNGSFTLKNVPRGRRKIVAWAPNADPREQWVNVTAGGTVNVKFKLSRRKARRHLNKYNQPYGSYEK